MASASTLLTTSQASWAVLPLELKHNIIITVLDPAIGSITADQYKKQLNTPTSVGFAFSRDDCLYPIQRTHFRLHRELLEVQKEFKIRESQMPKSLPKNDMEGQKLLALSRQQVALSRVQLERARKLEALRKAEKIVKEHIANREQGSLPI